LGFAPSYFCTKRCKEEWQERKSNKNTTHETSGEDVQQSSTEQSKGGSTGLGFLGGAIAGAGLGASSILGSIGKGISNMNKKEEDKAAEIAAILISSDKDELEQQITYLFSIGQSTNTSIIKNPCIEKIEFAIMKYRKFGQTPELEHFEKQLKKLKRWF